MKAMTLSVLCFLAVLISPRGVDARESGQDSAEERLEEFLKISSDESDRAAMIAELCRGEWPSDFSMQAYCREQQTEGFVSFVALWNDRVVGNSDLFPAGAKCILDWGEDGSFDYSMIHYCLDQQVEAYDSLR